MPGQSLNIGIDARYVFAREKTGIENYTTALIRSLGRLPELPPVTLYTDAPPEIVDGEAEEILENPRLRVRVVPRRRPWLRFWLPLAARREGISVMHFPGSIVSAWLPYRTVVTIYDLTALRAPTLATGNEGRVVDTVVRRSVRRSAHVLAISEATARDVRELFGVPRERITVTPLAPHARFQPVPGAAERVAQRFGLRQGYLLFVGTPYPRKNLRGALEAMAHLGAAGEGVALAIAGRKAWVDPGMRQMAAALGIADRAVFLGDVPDEDMPALYSAALALLHPAFSEGFCLPLVEAMACGTPVVTSATSVMPEVAGDAAVLVDPAQPLDIAEGVQRLLSNAPLRAECARRGRERVREFSWERTAALTLDAYRAAASSSLAKAGFGQR